MADEPIAAPVTVTAAASIPARPLTGPEILAQAAAAKAEQEVKLESLVLQPLRHSESLAQLALALSKAQGRMGTAVRDSTNPFFKSKYADLAAVWNACREALSTNEIAVIQPVTSRGRAVIVTTLLVHSSGEWIEERLVLIAAQDTPQAVGSAMTFGRRYGLSAMVGVAPADDDGAAASNTMPPGVKWDKGQQGHAQTIEGATDELSDAPITPILPEAPGVPATALKGDSSLRAASVVGTEALRSSEGGSMSSGQGVGRAGTAVPPAGHRVGAPKVAAVPVVRAAAGSVPPPPGRPPMRAPGT